MTSRRAMMAEMMATTTEIAARAAVMNGMLASLVEQVGRLAEASERQAGELERLADRVTVLEAIANGHDAEVES